MRANNQRRAAIPPRVPPMIAPKFGVRDTADAEADCVGVGDDVADVNTPGDDMVLMVVVSVRAVGVAVVGLVSGTVA